MNGCGLTPPTLPPVHRGCGGRRGRETDGTGGWSDGGRSSSHRHRHCRRRRLVSLGHLVTTTAVLDGPSLIATCVLV